MSSFNELANAIRFLSVDAVDKAQSGHPGMPLGMADIATVLWKKFLKFNPKNPYWFNRDRFVLSNGHGSMLLYALLHLTGYKLNIEDIQQFRQLHSKTPGHPECVDTPGVETTTGPLGQGLGNAVGMAIAEKTLAAQFNQSELSIIDHHTYAFVGDGCLMEGISHEVCSLAGTLKLGKLIVFYDDNGISIDGQVENWFTDNTPQRFQAYGWQVIENVDGHNFEAIEQAIDSARENTHQPSLIICKTTIGKGSLNEGTESVHGAPLGQEDIQQLRKKLNWPCDPFEIPKTIYSEWDHSAKGAIEEQAWIDLLQTYKHQYQENYLELLRRANGDLPGDWSQKSEGFIEASLADKKPMATRKASQQCIEYYASLLPELLGGSADLTGSNNTNWSGTKGITSDEFKGNYLYYGVREFGMASIMNGLALHGGLIPYGGTFLVFSDYARNAIRLSAMMQQRVIYVLTHDSIGLGEDGPTHQPIEHASMLRNTPNLDVWRPADLTETAVAWQQAIEKHHGPSCLLLSRQSLPVLELSKMQTDNIKKGAYVLKECDQTPDIILLATGSELKLALEAYEQLRKRSVQVRLVSMPCPERFLKAPKSYQEEVLPHAVRNRIAIEAASKSYWFQFVGLDGKVIGLDSFGVSAKAEEAYQALGIHTQAIIEAADSLLKSN